MSDYPRSNPKLNFLLEKDKTWSGELWANRPRPFCTTWTYFLYKPQRRHDDKAQAHCEIKP